MARNPQARPRGKRPRSCPDLAAQRLRSVASTVPQPYQLGFDTVRCLARLVVLPNADDGPPILPEQTICLLVPRRIPQNLLAPPFRIRLRPRRVVGTRM